MSPAVSDVLPRFWSVGAETADVGCATLTYRTGLVAEPTATFLHDVRAEDRDGLDGALDRAAQLIDAPCQRVFLGTRSPAWVEAELVARDWRVESTLQLVLPPGARAAYDQRSDSARTGRGLGRARCTVSR